MPELWKTVVNYEGLYEVSNRGRVRSFDRLCRGPRGSTQIRKGRILSAGKDGSGYLTVSLSKSVCRTHKVHRLVAEAFIENPSAMPVVNHRDGIKTNNNWRNLEWTDHKGNHSHAIETGLSISIAGSSHHMAKLDEEGTRSVILRLCNGESCASIARSLSLDATCISQINRGKSWRHVTVEGCHGYPYRKRKVA